MQESLIHNMLGSIEFSSRHLKVFAAWVFRLLVLGVALGAFTWNADSVFFGGNVYFTDGDCYARMTRVRLLQEHPLAPIRQHDFENYPIGTRPHTTAPLDYLIAGFAVVLRIFSREALSLAGAWISPMIGVLTLGILAVWWRKVPFGGATILLLAVSPIISHGFLLGRPDHQSLLMLLISVALAAEVDMWRGIPKGARGGKQTVAWASCPCLDGLPRMGRMPMPQELANGTASGAWMSPGRMEWISAVAWALALWVSLFEPLILLSAVLLLRACARRLVFARTPLVIFGAILLTGFLVDGFHVAAFDAHFSSWALNIGELRHASLPVVFSWAGWLLVLAPIGLLAGFFKKREPVYLLLCGLTLMLFGLTFWHLRWGYFFVIVFALSLPWLLPLARWKVLGWSVLILSLWPVAGFWDGTLYPDDETFRSRGESVVDAVALRDAAIQLKGLPEHGVIAPWWFSPAVVWWSGQPCVAGTSHQSLPGIVDASEFFLSEGSGQEILLKRKAGYIIAYEPDRVISNAAQILNRAAPSNPLARRLYDHPRLTAFRMLYANRFFKVFENPQK